jgi:hypothetical protein
LKPIPSREIELFEGISTPAGTRVRIHGQAPGLHAEKLCRLLTERYTPGIWEGRELFVRREGQDWIGIEDMDPGRLIDTIEYDGTVDGLRYHVYGGLMTRRNVVYNRAFIGFAYRFIEDTTELFEDIRSHTKDWLAAAEQKAEAPQLQSLALELAEYLERMS